MPSSEGLLQIILTLILAITAARGQLYHGFDDNDDAYLVELLLMADPMAMEPPMLHGYGAPSVRIVKREEPFFKTHRPTRRSGLPAPRRIESKAYANKYFEHRQPRLKRMPVEYEPMKGKMGMPAASEKRSGGMRRVKRQPVGKGVKAESSGDLVWHWRGDKKKHVKKPATRNRVGRPVVNSERVSAQFYDPYSSDAEPLVKNKKRTRYGKKPKLEEPTSDPLESPAIRLAVAVALGALVTCGVYAIASLIAMMFPSYFGNMDDDSEDILSSFSSTKPVRYVPVPVVNSETAMI